MSSHRSGRSKPLSPAPPPPIINRNSSRSNDGKRKSTARRRSESRSASRERYLRTRQDSSHGTRRRSISPPPRARSRSPITLRRPSREHENTSRSRNSTIFSEAGPSSIAISSGSSHLGTEPSSSRMSAPAQGNNILLASDFAPIIRAITNPEDVKIPRRLTEGIRQVFDRPELKDAMRRRMQADDNEVNVYVQPPQPPVEPPNQRVVAIIREPIDYISLANSPSAAAGSVSSSGAVGVSRHGIISSSGFKPSPPPSLASRVRSPPTPDELRARRMSPEARLSERHRSREHLHRRPPTRERDVSREVQRPSSSKSVAGRFTRERSPMRNPSPPPSRSHYIRECSRSRSHREVHMSPPPEIRRDHHRNAPPSFNPDVRDRHVFVENDGNRRHSPEMIRRQRSTSPTPRHHVPRANPRSQERDLRNTLSRPPKNFGNRFETENRHHRDFPRGGGMRGRGFSRGRRP